MIWLFLFFSCCIFSFCFRLFFRFVLLFCCWSDAIAIFISVCISIGCDRFQMIHTCLHFCLPCAPSMICIRVYLIFVLLLYFTCLLFSLLLLLTFLTSSLFTQIGIIVVRVLLYCYCCWHFQCNWAAYRRRPFINSKLLWIIFLFWFCAIKNQSDYLIKSYDEIWFFDHVEFRFVLFRFSAFTFFSFQLDN